MTTRIGIRQILFIYVVAALLVSMSFYADAKEEADSAAETKKEQTKADAKKEDSKAEGKKEEEKKASEKKKKEKKGKAGIKAEKSKNCSIKGAKNVFAKFETNKGNFKAKLFSDKAPNTVENFVCLAEGINWKTKKPLDKPFYDGVIFHRIIPGFMIQGGDPTGTGMGGPGYKFDNEIAKDLSHGKAGILSMANAGANTNGSQFFITVADAKYLDGSYNIFGEIVEGLDKVIEISKVKTGAGDRPVDEVKIIKVTIER
ncbi:MAG: peptidylprolyl isomerase [Pseudobdellovibrionaceae bacterium]